MKCYQRKLLFLFTFISLLSSAGALSQGNAEKKTVLFKSGDYSLAREYVPVLNEIARLLKDENNFNIRIEGHTDNTGSQHLNRDLSLMRALTVRKFLIDAGFSQESFIVEGFGPEKPVADNATEEGKRMNRRVDIFILRNNPDTLTTFTESISVLYQQLEPPPLTFCIDPRRDTVLRCPQGTAIYVKANSLSSSDCGNACITFVVKEAYLKSDMVMMNLSTTSNGEIIETQGMIFTDAYDCNGRQLELQKGKDLVIVVPTDTVIAGAKIFEGARGHDSIMNWTVSNNSILSDFTLEQVETCGWWLCIFKRGVPCDPCRLRCQLGRVGKALAGLFSNKIREENREFNQCRRDFRKARDSGQLVSRNPTVIDPRPPLDPQDRTQCERLEALFREYGVDNVQALLLAINKPLLDSFRVSTIQELQDTLTKVAVKKIELSYMNKKVSYEDFSYYVYNTSKLGWSNVDVFADIPESNRVTLKTNLPQAKNVDCKLVFKSRRFVIPAESDGRNLVFKNVPQGEIAILVAVKYEDGIPYLSMKEVRVEAKMFEMEFKQLTFEQLKEQLRKLD